MTLHEAIEKLLIQMGRSMTTTEIADELNNNKWYQKMDGSPITAFQIHGRTRKYPHLFGRDGSTVYLLNNQNTVHPDRASLKKTFIKSVSELNGDVALQEKVLMNEKNFKNASSIDNLLPECSGIYCIRIRDNQSLPAPFDQLMKERGHNIIYIGIASQCLKTRFLNQELRAKGHGTFFRSIGAILGYLPPKGSLVNKRNKKNYKYDMADSSKIISWINSNLLVYWIACDYNIDEFETQLIRKYLPLLNLAKNPLALTELSELRKKCVLHANSID